MNCHTYAVVSYYTGLVWLITFTNRSKEQEENMKSSIALLCLLFSGSIYAFGGGSTVTVPYVVCMQDGKMISVTAVPVTECDKLKKQKSESKTK